MTESKSIILISFVIIFVGSIGFASALSNGDDAVLVLGQPDFTTTTEGNSATIMDFPYGIAFDNLGNMWVADLENHRLLQISPPFSNGKAATIVLGQKNFTGQTANGHGSQNSALNHPFGLSSDSSNNVWVADFLNHRILRFSTPFTNGEAATLALGQSGLTGISSGTTATTLNNPQDMTFDSSGNLWVTDSSNHRVLRYDAPFTTGDAATLVLGQKNFTAGTVNGHGTQANALSTPKGLDFDSSGNLWISDSNNNRLLRFNTPFSNGQAPSLVLGQADFTSSTIDRTGNGNEAANTLHAPQDVLLDSSGNVWVVDDANHRILRYDAPFTSGESATLVLGQATFSVASANRGGSAGAGTLSNPGELAIDSVGNLWVSDGANNRVFKYSGGDAALVEANRPRTSSGDTSAPTLGKSATGRQVVENGFSYQSNLGGFTQLDADLGLTHMDSLPVAVGGIPDAPPGEIRNDIREKLNERGLGDVAKTFDDISDAIDNLDNFFNRPLSADASPDEASPTPQEITGILDNLKQGLDQSRVDPESHQNQEQAAQINNLLDRIAQKIAEIEDTL